MRTFEQRFRSYFTETPGCWIWQGAPDKNGYGTIWRDKKLVKAHRVAWELRNGPIPKGKNVLHTCDNPPCVNPNHLFVGNQQDNVHDCAKKGRRSIHGQKGEQNASSTLTQAQVDEIRKAYVKGQGASIGRKYGVRAGCISRIINRQRWNH